MLFYTIFGDYLVHFRSFTKNQILELFIMDVITSNIYFKLFICKDSKFPNDYKTETCQISNDIEPSKQLYLTSYVAKFIHNIEDLEYLLINVNNTYNPHDKSYFNRHLDIYHIDFSVVEVLFANDINKSIYFKLKLISNEAIEKQLMKYYTLACNRTQNFKIKKIMDKLDETESNNQMAHKKLEYKYHVLNTNLIDLQANLIRLTRQRHNSV